MDRASLNASSATGAQRVVDGCQVVFNLNCTVGTYLLALHAANASVCANLAGKSTLIMVGAFNNYVYGVVYKLDDVVGAFASAHAAANALFGVDLCNTVFKRDRVFGADTNAVAVTEAGIIAGLVTVIQKVCCNTALIALVVVFLVGSLAVSVTSNVCNLFNNVLSFYTKDSRNFFCGIVTAGNAKVCFVFTSVSQCFGITVATGIAASATVCTRQTSSDCNCGFVFLYAKKAIGERQNNCTDQRDNAKKDGGN